jgi:hypothetical protein
MAKGAKNERKVTAVALLFCCFLPTYEKLQKSLKMDEKLRLLPYFLLFFATYEKWEKLLKMDEKLRL